MPCFCFLLLKAKKKILRERGGRDKKIKGGICTPIFYHTTITGGINFKAGSIKTLNSRKSPGDSCGSGSDDSNERN